MGYFEDLPRIIDEVEKGQRDLFDAYLFIWTNLANVPKEAIEPHINRTLALQIDHPKAKQWQFITDVMKFTFWPGTGNLYQQLWDTINLLEESGNEPDKGVVLVMFGLYYKNLGQLDKAQEAIHESIELLVNKESHLYFLGIAYYQSAEIYQVLKDYDSALNTLNAGLDYFKNSDSPFKARFMNGIGNIHKSKGEFDEALKYFNESLSHIEGKQQAAMETKHYSDLGNYYLQLGDFEMALENQLKSVDIRKSMGQTSPLITNYIELAELFLKQNRLKEALEYALLAEKLSNEHNIIIKKYQSDIVISNIYEAMGETTLALDYYKRYHVTKDQVVGNENARKIKQLSLHHEMESMQKEKEIFKLRNVVLKEALDEIEASVRYAKRIQEAILPSIDYIGSKFDDAFVLYQPKDVVAGDFYWMEESNDYVFFAVADCTGHGVPGAMLSVVCSNSLNRAVNEFHLISPAEILEKTTELVCETFAKGQEEVNDGMDISLIVFNKLKSELMWSGANNPLWFVQNGEFKEISAVRRPIGRSEVAVPFESHQIDISSPVFIYLFTDGYADQFGGPKGKKFKYTQLKELLLKISHETGLVQQKELNAVLQAWKGNLEQIDDICVVGIILN